MNAIGKTNPFISQFAINSYSSAKPVNMNPKDISLACHGMRFTQPDWLAEGLNPFSNGACGDGLNQLNNIFKTDDEGFITAAQTTWSCIA